LAALYHLPGMERLPPGLLSGGAQMRYEHLLGLTACACVFWIAGCSAGAADGDENKPLPPPTGKDGKHFLADKPLTKFPDKVSEQWKLQEAMELAEKRAESFKDRHSVVVDPDRPDPLRGKPFGLEQALDGIEGEGPVKAVFETTLGEFTCELDTENKPFGTAHFIGLARGKRPWWDAAIGAWSMKPLYSSIPIYKVVPGQALYSGCPMGVGFGEIGFRTAAPIRETDQAVGAYQLALISPGRAPAFGAQFLVTAKERAAIADITHVIGTCEGANTIQKIAGQTVIKTGHPVEDIVIRRVRIER
jgi:peptidyl-prolyl cis-trans isomerase A (cyclophilin A)